MTENYGNKIWKYVLSEKRLNDVLDWHASHTNNKISKEEEINILEYHINNKISKEEEINMIAAMNYDDDRNEISNLWDL